MPYALSKVGKPEMVLKDQQLTAIQYVHNGKNVLNFYGVLPFVSCFASASERYTRSGILPSTLGLRNQWPQMMLELYILPNILSVLFQLPYLNELYGECNRTARACANNEYQELFSPITERLGTRLPTELDGYLVWTSSHLCRSGTEAV